MENLTWFGNAGFCFEDRQGNKVYFIDPLELRGRAKKKADIIFITHAHQDHFSPKDIEEIIKPETVIVAPPDITSQIDKQNEKVDVEPNKEYEVKGFKFSTIPAYNNHPDRLQFHPKSSNWVGYIFSLNGKKIYHSGDTDYIPEMDGLKKWNIDVAMIPIGGHYTMGPDEAAKAANAIGAKITIPMHFRIQAGEKADEYLEEFKKLVTNSEVKILEEVS